MGGKRKEKKEKGKGKKERGLTGFLREGDSRILRGRGRSQIKEGRKRERDKRKKDADKFQGEIPCQGIQDLSLNANL